jgi:GTP-binding protein Era
MTEFRSGFVAIVGRPNVGKSALLNALMGQKVTIVSRRPNTTRRSIRGILTDTETQIVFVDTPGIHRPKSMLGERLNATALEAAEDVDLQLCVIDATAPVGPGDSRVLEIAPKSAYVVLNKCDVATPDQIARQLTRLSEFDKAQYFPVSARSKRGIPELLASIRAQLVDPIQYYPFDALSDQSESAWIADLVREQLLALLDDELPHSVACRVVEMDAKRIKVEILVERESQKPIVIGRKGENLKRVGSQVRSMLSGGIFLELFVRVEANWQSHEEVLDELGL